MLRIGATSLALFALLALVVPRAPLHAERSWAELMADGRTPVLTEVALACNWLGRGVGRALVVAVPGVVLLGARRFLAVSTLALVEAITPLAATLLRTAVGRPRPHGGLVHPMGASFPSGHTAFAAATCAVLVLLLAPRRRAWWVLAATATVAMAWSRTYLQVHWLLDVLGGALLGLGVAFSVFAALSDPASRARLHRER